MYAIYYLDDVDMIRCAALCDVPPRRSVPRHHEVLPGVPAAGPAARRERLRDDEDAVGDVVAPLREEVHALVREDEPRGAREKPRGPDFYGFFTNLEINFQAGSVVFLRFRRPT